MADSRSASRDLPPFLEWFRSANRRNVSAQILSFKSNNEIVMTYFAKLVTSERLPGLLLIHDRGQLDPWIMQTARELSSIGYAVSAVDMRPYLRTSRNKTSSGNERAHSDLSTCVRWLRRRPDVAANKIGIIGWGGGGTIALRVAGSMAVQACVVCDSAPSLNGGDVNALARIPLLFILSGDSKSDVVRLQTILDSARISHRFISFDGTHSGFMIPARNVYAKEHAEHAWFEMYNFLGKHVEDADLAHVANISSSSGVLKQTASIADIMRAVNSSTGIRGALSESLSSAPVSDNDWKMVRSRAATLVEIGSLLKDRTPSRGNQESWVSHVSAYTEAARMIVAAADMREYESARRGLDQLTKSCSSCHMSHR